MDEKNKTPEPGNAREQDKQTQESPRQFTEVKNAHASGMGSIGRNSEEPTSIDVEKKDSPETPGDY